MTGLQEDQVEPQLRLVSYILQDSSEGVDVPLVKLFEFLVASMCLFLVPEGDGDPLHGNEVWLAFRALTLHSLPLCFTTSR